MFEFTNRRAAHAAAERRRKLEDEVAFEAALRRQMAREAAASQPSADAETAQYDRSFTEVFEPRNTN